MLKLSHNVFLAAALAVAMAACSNSPDEDPVRETVEVTFSVLSTKSVEDDETNIVTLDALAFRFDGTLDSYARADAAAVTLPLTKGAYISWWVVANAPEGALSVISTETAMSALRSALAENASNAFVMTARGSGVYEAANQTVNIDLTRLVSKVSIGKLTASFLGTGALSAADMTLDAAYLINASANVKYDITPLSESWYNQLRLDGTLAEPVKSFLWKDAESLELVPAGNDLGYYFYTCPNPVSNAATSAVLASWTPRNTRLVLETSIDGVKNYYPITLPAMQCNYEYLIEEVELLGFGSDGPDVPVVRDIVRYAVVVNPWQSEEKHYIMD